jgi:glycosyltransferase involved in cell wall biosynthesis
VIKIVLILGIRGIPARHGGFETFAEHLCKYLIKKNWQITVYCQEEGKGAIYETVWEGIRRIHIPVNQTGPFGTIVFDFKSIVHSLKQPGIYLTLGYNTAIFNLLYRVFGKTNIINMDGIEWKRQKWGSLAKAWFWLNERFGCWFGTHLIADHPRIADHLATRVSRKKITMIPYGAPDISAADMKHLEPFGLVPEQYSVIIARPEPENSILEVVKAFSAAQRQQKLVVLGDFYPDQSAYHQAVMAAASDEIIFPGAIYDHDIVAALRFYARFYIHGHQVGGTNPSLVEGLGAGCAVIAHDNRFNRWVAGDGAYYFDHEQALTEFLQHEFLDDQFVETKSTAAKLRFLDQFQWQDILQKYENLLLKHIH